MKVLGAHMLEICPSIAAGKPSMEIHPLGIGGKADPVRLVFDTPPGPGLNASLIDLGNRFRMLINEVDVVKPEKPLPKLPVARAVWVCRPNLATAASAWIYAGGAHHTGFSQAVTTGMLEHFENIAGIEIVIIDADTRLREFRKELRSNEDLLRACARLWTMKATPTYTIGLDLRSPNSVRALIVDSADGREIGTAVWNYEHGDSGVILSRDPNLARQHPADYLKGAEVTIKKALADAKKKTRGFKPEQVVGIGVDTTGSTPLPVDGNGNALALNKRFAKNPAAMAWLWKDHTGVAEAAEITELGRKVRPQYLAKCGGTYSSEWFFSKILHCLRTSPEVYDAAASWVELADFVPAALSGTQAHDKFTAGICAAGHKALYSDGWGGYPDAEFLGRLSPKLGLLRERLCPKARDVSNKAGSLTAEWAQRTGLRVGIPVAIGAFDAHLGAIGAGIAPGTPS